MKRIVFAVPLLLALIACAFPGAGADCSPTHDSYADFAAATAGDCASHAHSVHLGITCHDGRHDLRDPDGR